MRNYLIIIVCLLAIALEGYSQVPDTLCFQRTEIEKKQARYDQRGLIIQRRDSIIAWQIDQLQIREKEINSLSKDKVNLNSIITLKDQELTCEKRKKTFLKYTTITFGGTTVCFGLAIFLMILAK